MTPEDLEHIISTTPDPDRRSTAYAALTLTRILSPEWTHVVAVREGKKNAVVRHETIQKPAGVTFGDVGQLKQRLDKLLSELA